MIVYVLMSGEYDEYDIEGAYSCRDTAEWALSHCPKSRFPFIREIELDGKPEHYREKTGHTLR